MSMKVQIPVKTGEDEDVLSFIRQMGIEDVSMIFSPEELNYETIMSEKTRLEAFGLRISDAACMPLQKNRQICLGLEGRDQEIAKFNEMLRVFGKAGIPFTSVAWQPHGILRTGHRAGKHTRGGISSYADQDEILSRPNAESRVYSEEEIWDNFRYFCEQVIPVAEETGVRLALHPNDPPLPCMAGIPSLIYNTACYEKAFDAAGRSKALGMKLCIGCWLEGGSRFGDLMADIETYCKEDRILCVHFRNVSSTLPFFEETLAEDGYANMYRIMKQLAACGCNAVISIDHAFKGNDKTGGRIGAHAYPTGYLKGLLHAAEEELKREG